MITLIYTRYYIILLIFYNYNNIYGDIKFKKKMFTVIVRYVYYTEFRSKLFYTSRMQ